MFNLDHIRKQFELVLLSLLFCLSLTALAVDETGIEVIPLGAPLDEAKAEISGLTWCQDRLILLPQYPKRLSDDGKSYFYYLERQDILGFLNNLTTQPLTPKPILINEKDLRKAVSIFDGFEAIECRGNKLWLSIEAVTFLGEYQSFVVPADIQFGKDPVINIDQKKLTHLPSLSKMVNMGDEAIIMDGDDVIAIHEINDPRTSPEPNARRITRKTSALKELSFPSLPYRITDATKLDKNNKFWAINYKYSGDKFSRNADDPIAERYGQGASHKQYYNVERLLEFELNEDGISLTNLPPIQLKMEAHEGRNWEGLVRLNQLGFLLVTDKHPKTLLAFLAIK